MPELAETRLHKVYQAERWGDTLVVVPLGDAMGFSVTSVNSEMSVIKGLAESRATKHLIVDLSRGNYFGSIVLGALISLGTAVRDQGGRIALSGASKDMQDVLRLMKLDRMWEMFPDRASAMRTISKVPVTEKLWSQRRVFMVAAVIAAAAAAFLLMPQPQYGRAEYEELIALWQEVESRRNQAGIDEWSRLQRKCQNRIEEMVRVLEQRNRQRGSKGMESFVIFAGRDHLLPSLERSASGTTLEYHRHMVQFYLRCCQAELEGRPVPQGAAQGAAIFSPDVAPPAALPAAAPPAMPTPTPPASADPPATP
ncbi:MAG: STAS domain-containing protein [Planctomycetaceae bacterium]|nr:STAS domain-containing protein [Planctomycetaceae bacterium]